jgi:hypothetical protein
MLECYGPPDQERASIDRAPAIPGVQWVLGQRFSVPIPTPLEITLDPGLMMPMFYKGILLWSDALIAAVREEAVDNFDTYDAVLLDPSTGKRYTDYKAVNIIGLVAAADLSKSKYSAPSGRPVIDTDFDSVVIDESKTYDLPLFRLAECVTAIVIHENVRKRIESRGIRYLDFVSPEKWIG